MVSSLFISIVGPAVAYVAQSLESCCPWETVKNMIFVLSLGIVFVPRNMTCLLTLLTVMAAEVGLLSAYIWGLSNYFCELYRPVTLAQIMYCFTYYSSI